MWYRNRKARCKGQFRTHSCHLEVLDKPPCDSRLWSSRFQFQGHICQGQNHQWPSFHRPMWLIRVDNAPLSMFQVVAKHHFWIQRWLLLNTTHQWHMLLPMSMRSSNTRYSLNYPFEFEIKKTKLTRMWKENLVHCSKLEFPYPITQFWRSILKDNHSLSSKLYQRSLPFLMCLYANM